MAMSANAEDIVISDGWLFLNGAMMTGVEICRRLTRGSVVCRSISILRLVYFIEC